MGIDLDEACETLRGLGYEVENQNDEWVITTPRTRYPLVRDGQGLILFAQVIGKHAAGILSRRGRPE